MGFPTKNDHFGVFWGYHHLRKQPEGVTFFVACFQLWRRFDVQISSHMVSLDFHVNVFFG